ncbi:MAG: F0F1 ATP synthase subunit gamma [Actinomycetota bacterium]|nr:F0F1 ATP synthase subunit gamma [Actinomycetota bacterium]
MAGGAELRDLRDRIDGVKSTKKMTHAMEMIAASRIAEARARVEAARPYAEQITEMLRDLAGEEDVADHPLIAEREQVGTVGVVVIASDRGLAGAYNANVLRRGDRLMDQERQADREVVVYTVGRKAETHYRYRGDPPEEAWRGVSDKPSYAAAQEIGGVVMAAYESEQIDRLWLVYTDFRSAMVQEAVAAMILPVDPRDLEDDEDDEGHSAEFMFEPEPAEILERLIPSYVVHRIFAALLEAAASEHAMRQRAMKAATDNAEELIDDLQREANSARQAAITSEIAEITAGAEALQQG